MKEITIQLTEQQEHFLRLLATNHYPNAKDNLCTIKPIHIVQTRDERIVDPDYDTPDVVKYYVPEWTQEYDTAEELIRDFYDDIDCPIPIVSFDTAYNTGEFTDIHGEAQIISDEDDYLEAYGIDKEFYEIAHSEYYFRDIAFFFILSEAKRYIEYQGHNLNNPRTYSYGPGYANHGEYEHFYDLLQSIGNKLNEEGGQA